MKNELFWEVPSSLILKTTLEKKPPEFKYNIDKFYYILDYLCRGMDLEDLDNNEGFINLNAKKLQKVVHDYKKYLDYLLKRRIIRTDMNYVVGKKSKGYLIQGYKEYKVSVERIPITSFPMIKRKRRELAEIEQDNKATAINYPHITKWFNNRLQIDINGAKQRVELLFPEQTGGIRGKRKGEPSNYITYDGQKLVNVDIKNSQPLFSQLLFSKSFYDEKSGLSIYNFPFSLKLFSNNSFSYPPSSLIIMVVKSLENIDREQVDKYISFVNSGEFYKLFYTRFHWTILC